MYYFSGMDRKQKIMRLIIEALEEKESLKYTCSGAVTVFDPNLISLDFTVRNDTMCGDMNVRGLIDAPLRLVAQYDSRYGFEDHPSIRKEIEKDLQVVSDKINRLL